jgi:hypothetical protein
MIVGLLVFGMFCGVVYFIAHDLMYEPAQLRKRNPAEYERRKQARRAANRRRRGY